MQATSDYNHDILVFCQPRALFNSRLMDGRSALLSFKFMKDKIETVIFQDKNQISANFQGPKMYFSQVRERGKKPRYT